jgi:AraC family transcriptional regulator
MNLKYAQFVGEVSNPVQTPRFAYSVVSKTEGLEVPLHSHVDAHFQLIIDGRFSTIAWGGAAPIGPGALIYNPRGVTHRDQFVTPRGRFATASIDSGYLAEIEAGEGLIDYPVVFQDTAESWLATQLWFELRYSDNVSETVAEALSIELFTRLRVNEPTPDTRPAWFSRAVDIVEDRFRDSIRVGDVAAAVDVHPFHLTRTFRRFMGCTTGEYLRICRVRRACELLRGSSHSLAQIACLVGFADQSELTKAMRRYTRFTPARYRAGFGTA